MQKYLVSFHNREDVMEIPADEVQVEAENEQDAVEKAWGVTRVDRSHEAELEIRVEKIE